MTAVADPLQRVLDRLQGVRPSSNGQYMACCPAHDDGVPSLSVGTGDDGQVLLHCFAGCPVERIVAAIGLEMRDLFPDDGHRGNGRVPPPPRRSKQNGKPEPTFASPEAFAASELRNVKSRFDYHDANGELVYVVFRIEPPGEKKLFLPAHRQADGRWIGTHIPAPRPLYRLPQ